MLSSVSSSHLGVRANLVDDAFGWADVKKVSTSQIGPDGDVHCLGYLVAHRDDSENLD